VLFGVLTINVKPDVFARLITFFVGEESFTNVSANTADANADSAVESKIQGGGNDSKIVEA
jgi:hypothetical protein